MKVEIYVGKLPWNQEHHLLSEVKNWALDEFPKAEIRFIKTDDNSHGAIIRRSDGVLLQKKTTYWTNKLNECLP